MAFVNHLLKGSDGKRGAANIVNASSIFLSRGNERRDGGQEGWRADLLLLLARLLELLVLNEFFLHKQVVFDTLQTEKF